MTDRAYSVLLRWQLAREQAAYRRRIAAFGLPAVLAPYSLKRLVRIPGPRMPS